MVEYTISPKVIMVILLLGTLFLIHCGSIDAFSIYGTYGLNNINGSIQNYPVPKMFVRSGYDSGTREYNNPIYALQVAQGLDTN